MRERRSRPVTVLVFAAAFALAAANADPPLARSDPAPMPSPTPSPLATASPVATASPAPTPTVLMLPPDSPPQILWYRLSSTTPRAGDTLTVTVLASSNVASVEVRIGGYGFNLPKTDVGHFEGGNVIPALPFFVSHTLVMQIIARNTAGAAVENSVTIQVR